MPIEIVAVGGYSEVGRNMTAIRVGDEVIILDCGLHLPNYINATDQAHGEFVKKGAKSLQNAGAIPDDRIINDWRKDVKAIIVTHAHLDHLGAMPFLENKYNAPLVMTPFSGAVLRTICTDEKIKLRNEIKQLLPNSSFQVTKNIKIEFIHTTHSVPQTVIVALHTPEGIIVYANDFKLDNSPTLGRKPNYAALKKLGDSGKVKALILEDLYVSDARKMPSEAIAKQMLRDVLLGVDNKGKGIVVTTFSSQIARLKSIVEMGQKLNRQVIFLGRSLSKYAGAAEEAGVMNFSKEGVRIMKFGNQVRRELSRIKKQRHKYMLVMTGHQGEPKAMLSRLARNQFEFRLQPEDHVIFSSKTIPAEINQRQRAELDSLIRSIGARIFSDVHISGHCAREDLRDVIDFIKAEHVFPTHGDSRMNKSFVSLAQEMGYTLKKDLHVLKEGQKFIVV